MADEISWNTLISACERSSEWQKAMDLLGVMEETTRPDLVTFNSLISACDAWPMALALLQAVEGKQLLPDVISLNAVIASCGAQWQMALSLLRETTWKDRLRTEALAVVPRWHATWSPSTPP